jgi:PII-like signaling protein
MSDPETVQPTFPPVSGDALKLTTYFGERSRVQGRLLADELLDIHARHAVRSSILLRGIQGFGAKHRRRSDRLLTLSEDLPLISVAVDSREQIESLLEQVRAIGHEGLIALERARLCGEPFDTAEPPSLSPGEALKLTVYLGRHDRAEGSPAFVAVCQTLHDSGVAGATVLLGVDGTRNGQRQRARFFAQNANVPLMVTAVGEAAQIECALKIVRQMLVKPLLTIERVRLCKRDGVLLDRPHDQPARAEQDGHRHDQLALNEQNGLRQKLTIVTSEAALHENRSVYIELVRRLRMADSAGATSLRGIWGFHGEHRPHGDRLLSIRRHVPVVTETIDTHERIAALFPIVDELTHERGLVTTELVPATSALHAVPGLSALLD